MEEFEDFPVDPLSDAELEKRVQEIATAMALPVGVPPTGLDLIEGLQNCGIELIPQADEAMGSKEGFTTFKPTRIFLRASAYRELKRGTGTRARFTLAHEAIHAFLHPGLSKPRMAKGNQAPFRIPAFKSAERQANLGAAILLMPLEVVLKASSPLDLSRICQVSFTAAEIRFSASKRDAIPRKEIPAVRDFLNSAKGFHRAANKPAEVLPKLSLWRALPCIEGENPYEYRMCGKYQIAWREFNRTTQCGWRIIGGKIVAWMSEASG